MNTSLLQFTEYITPPLNYTSVENCANWYLTNSIKIGLAPIYWTVFIIMFYSVIRLTENKTIEIRGEERNVTKILEPVFYFTLILMLIHLVSIFVTNLPQY